MIDNLRFCYNSILPFYIDDSLSDYELLVKIVDRINELVNAQNATSAIVTEHGVDIEVLKVEVLALQQELVKIANGEYMDVYINALASWIDRNLQQLVARIAKQVFFNLTLDGYFVAYIPESWSDIGFDTIMTCGNPNWGRLVLTY